MAFSDRTHSLGVCRVVSLSRLSGLAEIHAKKVGRFGNYFRECCRSILEAEGNGCIGSRSLAGGVSMPNMSSRMGKVCFLVYFTCAALCMMAVNAGSNSTQAPAPASCTTFVGEMFSAGCAGFLTQYRQSVNDALTARCCALAKAANSIFCYCDRSFYENAAKLGLPPDQSKDAMVLFCQVASKDIYTLGTPACANLSGGQVAASVPGSAPGTLAVKGRKGSGPVGLIMALSIAAAIVVTGGLIFCFFVYRRSRINQRLEDSEMLVDTLKKFSYSELESATNSFHELNKLGRGGFGVVYKGELPNGYEVAVKRLKSTSVQGDTEFVNEVRIISKVRHCNIVGLHGYCNDGSERMLVYPLMPRGSLNAVLFDRKNSTLSWSQRFRVIVGMARGLAYLHDYSTLSVVHCDVKPSNILLHDGADGDIEPCVADFGMARLMITQPDTISLVGGTRGYRAPEYANKGWLTKKVDVYSFGVVVLEILAGKPHFSKVDNEGDLTLLEVVQFNPKFDHTLIRNIIDVRVSHQISDKEALRMLMLSRMCTSMDVDDRPTMAQVLHMLEDWKEPATLVSDQSSSLPLLPIPPPQIGNGDPPSARASEVSTSTTVRESSENAAMPLMAQKSHTASHKAVWQAPPASAEATGQHVKLEVHSEPITSTTYGDTTFESAVSIRPAPESHAGSDKG